MTLPNLSGKATLDISEFRAGVKAIRTDLAAVQDLSKRAGTIRITADLSAAKDIQKATRAIRDAIQEAVPTDMQRRIDETFGAFSLGANKAQASAAVFEAQASALRARIDELDRAVKITRADFQAGFGGATPEETAKLGQEMARLSRELEKVGAEAKENFGEYSREVQKVANANKLAQTTAAAARGEITRLGLASQVKLGVGSALQQYGSQAGFAANNIFGLAKASDSARIAQGLFYKTMEKSGTTADAANSAVTKLQDTLGLTADAAREGIRGLTRQGFTLEQAFTTLQGAGASALAAGQDASAGIEAVNDAVASGSSARLNAISISENLSTYFQKEAKARGVTVDALDKQARAQAVVNLITAATTDEVGDLSAILGGVSGNLSGTSRALDDAGKKLGEAFIPLVTNGTRVLTKFLDIYNDLPEVGKNAVAILGASAVAVGFLAGPVGNLAKGYATIRDGLKGVKSASDALADGAGTLSDGASNIGQTADAYTNLASKARAFYASTSASLTTYVTSTLLASGATTVFSTAFISAVASTTLFTTALGVLTVGLAVAFAGVALATGAVVAYNVKLFRETTAIYDSIDAANNASFENTMKRVTALNKEGTELSRAQARALVAQQKLAEAEQGSATGKVNPLTGEREIKRNEEAIKGLKGEVIETRGEVVRLYTETQRRGQINLKLTEDQIKAVKDLRDTLAGRAFTLKVDGLSDFQADLARIKRDSDELRETFKKPFVVDGKLLDPTQTPALRQGLGDITAQENADVAAVRKRYADEAVIVARKSAVKVQDAEVLAMRDGQAKKTALRAQEIAAVRRDAKERIDALSDFPEQQKQLEADTDKIIKAKRRVYAEEDRLLVVDNGRRVAEAEARAGAAVIESMQDGLAKREAARAQELESLRRDVAERVAALAGDPTTQAGVQTAGNREIAAKQREQDRARVTEAQATARLIIDAERSARSGTIAAMEEGRAKREAVRNAELEDLRASIAEKVAALAGDPEAQRRVQGSGNREIAAKERAQNLQRVKEAQDTGELIEDAEKSARDGTIAAMQDGLAKREAIRAKDLEALRKSISERVKALEGDPEAQKSVQASGQSEINSKIREQAQERVKEEQTAQDQVLAARKSARSAAVALIEDEAQQRRAAREDEVAALQETLRQRLEAVKGYPQKQKEIQELARQEARNLEEKWAAEDVADATARAQRIADAYLKAQDAQFSAQQAGQNNQAAQYELTLARQLAAVKDNAVEGARIEAEALTQRAQFAEAQAQGQFSQDQKRLETTRIRALSDTKLSADERIAIWQTYYADLNTLSGNFQVGEKTRLAQQERDARAATEAIRLARIGEADKPVKQSQSRVQELQQSRDLVTSDAELLTIAQKISAERAGQIKALGDQLSGVNGVKLTTEERAGVEEKIKGLQHDQAVSLKDQQAVQKSLRDSTLDRLDAEAQYAEKVARTSAELTAARQQQLSVAQARLRELDGEIAGEGQEEKRNALVGQRLGLLEKITDLTQREVTAPIEADERRLKLYQAQAQIKLIASGQQDNEIAKSQLTLQIAAQELLLANRRVQAASTLLDMEAAQAEQAQVRLALAQAYAASQPKAVQTPLSPSITQFEDPAKRQQELRQQALARERELRQQGLDDLGSELDLQNKLQDVSEARTRGLAQITRVGDDAVASATLELSLTRERLKLTDAQLNRSDLGAAGRAALLQKRVDLLLKEEDQQRRLNETRRAAARLTEEVTLAEGRLNEALAGGNAEANGVTAATRQVAESRRMLALAEREYAQARQDADQVGAVTNLEKLKSATDAVAGAVGAHRSAIRNLAGEYRSLIGQMDSVRDAGEKLRQVAYGDATPFKASQERERLSAIAARRDAAQRELAQALASGNPEQIARAAEELTRQQERYNKQIELLGKNGQKVDDTGKGETQRLADAVDSLGIQYDREAVALAERARITDREAENALTLQGAAQTFDASTKDLASTLEGAAIDLAVALKQDKAERDSQVKVDRDVATVNRDITEKAARIIAAPPVPTLPPRPLLPQPFNLNGLSLDQFLDRLASKYAPPKLPGLPQAPPVTLTDNAAKTIGISAGTSAGAAVRAQLATTSATAPINNYAGDTYNMTVNGAPGQSPDQVANIVVRIFEDRARRSGRRCPP